MSPCPIYHKVNPSPVRESELFEFPNDFLKLNCKISQVYVTLINDFDKIFDKIKLNCDKENTLILNAVFKRRRCLT